MSAAIVLLNVADRVDQGLRVASVWGALHGATMKAVGGTTCNGGYPDLLGDVFTALRSAAGCSQSSLGRVLSKRYWEPQAMSDLLRAAAENARRAAA